MRHLEKMHPLSLFVYFLVILLITMFTSNPVFLGETLIGGVLFQLFLEKKRTEGRYFFWGALIFASGMINPLFTHNGETVLFYMNGRTITMEAFVYGLLMGMMLVAVLAWFQCFSVFMTREKLLYLFRKLPKLALVLTMAFRFVPLFQRKYERIKEAKKGMGEYKETAYGEQVKGLLEISSVLMTWSLENGMDTADSMKARGYGISGRTEFSLFRFRRSDRMIIILAVFTATLVFLGLADGRLSFSCYPKIVFSFGGKIGSILSFFYGFFVFLPVLFKLEEEIKWKFYKSKI